MTMFKLAGKSGSIMRIAKFMQNAKRELLNAKCKMSMLNANCKNLNAECEMSKGKWGLLIS